MKVLERLAGFQTELLGQDAAGAVERIQRLSLPPRLIEGKHQLGP
jgi:hypothetical protein